MSRRFRTEQEFPLPTTAVFPFFADVSNLERVTPPFLSFRVLTAKPVVVNEGTILDYRLRVHGLPVCWRSLIRLWEPPYRFVDEQIKGPYRRRIHEHRFEAVEGGTRMIDEIHYAAPGGRLVERLVVDRDVGRIFAYRATFLAGRFG